jgi:flagellar biosynthesis protein FlhF
MSLQTFRGPTLDLAKRSAEHALGKDYVVLSTKRLEKPTLFGFGRSLEFEITAAPKTNILGPKDARSPAHPFPAVARFGGDPNNAEMDAIRSEVRNEVRALRSLFVRTQPEDRGIEPFAREIEAELGLVQEMLLDLQAEREREPSAQLKRLLTCGGIEGHAARLVARMVRERGDDMAVLESFKAVLCDVVRTTSFPLSKPGKLLLSLVGPTGVGKTTTAAKLAAFAIHEQKRSVTLVSSDSFRVGAAPQLERFAQILGAEFKMVKTRHGLEEALITSTTDVVIIDTAGRPDGRDDIELSLARAASKNSDVERRMLLCVPAALREVDARRLAKSFAPCQPTELCVTKLDETSAPSGLLHATVATKLPISALCFGQRVPEDLSPAHPKLILEALTSAQRLRATRPVAS